MSGNAEDDDMTMMINIGTQQEIEHGDDYSTGNEEEPDDDDERVGRQHTRSGEGRQRKNPWRPTYDIRAIHSGFLHTAQLKIQHINNLVVLMRHYQETGNDAALALVLATLLQAQHSDNLSAQFQFRNKAAHARMSEVLITAYHLFRRHSGALRYEQLQRLLRRCRAFQLTPEGKAVIGIMLGQLSLDNGYEADAYDVLNSLKTAPNAFEEYQRLMLMAGIRHSQWLKAIKDSGLENFTPFCANKGVWGISGRNARDLCLEAQQLYSKAFELRPSLGDAHLAITELFIVQDKFKDASAWVHRQCGLTPCDSDAIGMALVLDVVELNSKQRKKRLHNKKKRKIDAHEDDTPDVALIQRASDFIKVRGSQCDAAINILIDQGRKYIDQTRMDDDRIPPQPLQPPPPIPLFEGLCHYLDCTPPLLNHSHGSIQLEAWKTLGECLVRMFDFTIQAIENATKAHLALRDSAKKDEKKVEDRMEEKSLAAQEACQSEIRALNDGYYAVVNLLQQRQWWLDCHLRLSKSASKMQNWMQQGIANAETLAHLAIVQFVVHHCVHVQETKLIRLEALPPALIDGHGHNIEAVFKALQGSDTIEIKNKLDFQYNIIRKGIDAVMSREEAVINASGALATHSRSIPLQDDLPISTIDWNEKVPLGTSHPNFGIVSRLTETWWTTFPYIQRRKLRNHDRQKSMIGGQPLFLNEFNNDLIHDGNERNQNDDDREDPGTTQRRKMVRFAIPAEYGHDDDDDDE